MPLNGTELVENPWNVTWSPFTDLFAEFTGNGSVFFLFPISVIATALYIKTQSGVNVSLFLIVSGVLLSSGGIFLGAYDMALLYMVVAALGFVGLFIGLFWGR